MVYQKDSKLLKLSNFGEILYSEDYIQITWNGLIKKYYKKDCVRLTIKNDLSIYDHCFRKYFPNGDVGFFYENEAFVLKIRGDIWIKN